MTSSVMIRSLFFTLALFVWGAHSHKLQELSVAKRHEQWMAKYGKVDKDVPKKEMRLQIFKDNVEFIEAFITASDKPYKLSANAFVEMINGSSKSLGSCLVDGCNHMQCKCERHLCWVFLKVFKIGEDCYDHLRSVHVGII